ncbi:MAG TPA: hypothetical protein VFT95_11330, partial [Micromonosporaceae bacterium]|nr:hypothetical protein [Micromonosporaceae bacterium]
MTRLVRILLAMTSALAATMVTAAGPVAAGATAPLLRQYRVVPLAGVVGERAGAFAMNDSGQVVGQFETAGHLLHPFRWQHGQMTDLGVLEAGPDERGMARDVNVRGD